MSVVVLFLSVILNLSVSLSLMFYKLTNAPRPNMPFHYATALFGRQVCTAVTGQKDSRTNQDGADNRQVLCHFAYFDIGVVRAVVVTHRGFIATWLLCIKLYNKMLPSRLQRMPTKGNDMDSVCVCGL